MARQASDPIVPDLPPDLTTCTDDQHQAAIDYLARKPASDLRRRQDLVRAQLARVAFNVRAAGNLQVLQRWLDAAVMRREFPNG